MKLKGLFYKNLQNTAEGGMAPRPMIPTAVICCQVCQHGMYRHPNCYTPLGHIYRVFACFYWQLLLTTDFLKHDMIHGMITR